jgi:hypothetical protein
MSDPHRIQAFHHAVRCLAHPLSLLGMAVLFTNDYYLRIVHPSWFTGKLGDFAWLFFFPFFLTALLVWVLPKAWLKGSTPILIGIGITALVFTLGNTVAPFLQWMIDVLEWVIPWQFAGVTDPTDLIALPVMGLTYLLWGKLPVYRTAQPPQLRWLWLGIALLLTMGNSAAPPTGITLVYTTDGEIYAEGDGFYKGSNGGLDWDIIAAYRTVEPIGKYEAGSLIGPIQSIVDPNNNDIHYRFNTGKSIERSTDGGKTWATEFVLRPQSEAVEAHYTRGVRRGYEHTIPFDAEFDPQTGNLIMTMKFDGMLVRSMDGEYHWVPVHNYSHQEINFFIIIALLIPGDVALAFFIGILSMRSFCWKDLKWFRKAFLILFFILILFTGIFIQPARTFSDYGVPFILFILFVEGIIALILLKKTIMTVRNPNNVIIFGLTAGILHLFPMFLWGYNIIPKYQLAFGIGVALSIGWTVFLHVQAAKMPDVPMVTVSEKTAE